MVLRILTTLLITSLWCGAADYQIANKESNGLQIVTDSLITSDWTNTVLWITANSPIVNSGSTNATWPCYAKNCGGNLIQPTLSSQPARLTTNGIKIIKFDGIDDNITTPVGWSNTIKKVEFVYYSPTAITKTSGGRAVYGLPGSSAYGFYIGQSTGVFSNEVLNLVYESTSVAAYLDDGTNGISAGFHKYSVVWSGTKWNIFLDDVNVTTTNIANINIPLTGIFVGGRGSAGFYIDGGLQYLWMSK